jgi:hypothetical protein
MREGCKSSGASEVRGSGVGERQRGGFPTGVGRRGEGGQSDRWGPVDRETRDRRAGWMGRPGLFWPAGTSWPVGWLGQRPNGPRGWPG